MIPATLEQLHAMNASHPFVVQVCAAGRIITGSRHETETLAMFAATRAERHLGRETKSGEIVDSIVVREMRGGEWVTITETEY